MSDHTTRQAADTADDPWRIAGGSWRVRVLGPAEVPASEPLPWLYALDGKAVELALLDHPPEAVRVVTVDHDPTASQADGRAARAYDYTPSVPGRRNLHDPRVPGWRAGGADSLLAFIAGPLRRSLEQRYAPGPRVLYGHSYGGLFVLNALFHAPEAFDAFVAASPALWWYEAQQAGQVLEAGLASLAARQTAASARVLVTAGGRELWHPYAVGVDGTHASRQGGMPTLPAARALAERLGRMPGLATRFHEFADATHLGMLARSARLAARLAADPASWDTFASDPDFDRT